MATGVRNHYVILRTRDIRFVRRQAILRGVLKRPDVDAEELIEALREEVLELRTRLARLEGIPDDERRAIAAH